MDKICVICGAGGNVVAAPRGREKIEKSLKRWWAIDKHTESKKRMQEEPETYTWHRMCYSAITHEGNLARCEARFEKLITSENTTEPTTKIPETPRVTRACSSAAWASLSQCFFCSSGPTRNQKLCRISTKNAAECLKDIVKNSKNEAWQIRLSGVDDIHAADITYHNSCWLKHVKNVQRNSRKDKEPNVEDFVREFEFIDYIRTLTENEKVVTMSDIERTFQNEFGGNIVRWRLKELIRSHIPELEFTRPLSMNKSETVHLPEVRRKVLCQHFENKNQTEDVSTLFKAAKLLRTELEKFEWSFDGSFENFKPPKLVGVFFKWLIRGQRPLIKEKDEAVEKRSSVCAQAVIFSKLTERQIRRHKETKETRLSHKPLPLQIGVGLIVHQETRQRKMLDLLHRLGFAPSYSRFLDLENALAHAVLQKSNSDNVFIPQGLVRDSFIHFAIDNIDFQEDTSDGKRTLHATIGVAFQEKLHHTSSSKLHIDTAKTKTISGENFYEQKICYFPKGRKDCVSPNVDFKQCIQHNVYQQYTEHDYTWLLTAGFGALDNQKNRVLPVWSAQNSILHQRPKNLTNICVLPLLDSPATEASSILTMLQEMEKINHHLNGNQSPLVIAADMDLYWRIMQLKLWLKKDWIVRIGDLHVVMAMLRTIGSFIESSGLDEIFVEAEVYSSATLRQILAGNHVNRGVEAHISLAAILMALRYRNINSKHSNLNLSALFQSDNIKDFQNAVKLIREANVINILEEEEIESENGKFCWIYIKMVRIMLMYFRAVRTGDWLLHLNALNQFTPFFFAGNKLQYARMVPVYVSEMQKLEKQNPEIWTAFIKGKWVINKSFTPFTGIGCDHALEQVNREMKISGGLIGITLQPNARLRFFLIQPELRRLKYEAMAALIGETNSLETSPKHHKLSLNYSKYSAQYNGKMCKRFDTT